MAKPLSADQALKAFREEGVRVKQYKGWKTHNRSGHGSWGPVHGVMIHHTVSSGTRGSVKMCRDGYAGLPGPLCHGVISKDGTLHLIGWGRANHAGLGDDDVLRAVIREGKLPHDNEANTDGNIRYYGLECINLGDGEDPWPKKQIDAMIRVSAALIRAHGWGGDGNTSVIGHREWQPGKADPCGFDMNWFRKKVAERVTG